MSKFIPESIFKSYDIRGIYPEEINEKNAVPIVRAIYMFARRYYPKKTSLTVVLGRDMRLSSPAIFKASVKTLVELGAKVIDPGLVATTTFYHTVYQYGYDCGIMITASHNPKDYNGLKIVINSPKGLLKVGAGSGMDEIKRMAIEGVSIPRMGGGKVISRDKILDDEYKKSQEIAGNPHIEAFTVVADPANAMGGPYIDHLFKQIPGKLVKMNFELDGTFPAHPSNPFDPTTLVDLQKKVVETGAHLGIAPDGDGDRMFFIDEKGAILPSSIITSLAVREILKNKPSGEKIIGDMKYQITPRYWVEKMGGEHLISKTGHTFITELMQKSGALFAGEASGHYYFKQTGGADAQIPIILIVLGVISREKKPLSEIAKELKRGHESGEINYKVKNAKYIMEKVKEDFADGEFSGLDGIALNYPDWRFSLRTSNTEPLLRLNVEEKLTKYKARHKKIERLIHKYAEFVG